MPLPVVGGEGDLEGVELLLVLVNVDHEPTPIAVEVDVIVEVVVTIESEIEFYAKLLKVEAGTLDGNQTTE